MEHLTHWKNQFNYDYLGVYSLPDGKDIILTIKETKKRSSYRSEWTEKRVFCSLFP